MSAQHAYIARLAGQTEAELRAIIQISVGAGYAFACDSVQLSTPQQLTDPSKLNLDGDFGHAYSAQAEVRWRRNLATANDGATAYDVLVLTEDKQLLPAGAIELRGEWRVRDVPKKRHVIQTSGNPNVELIEYCDARGGGATLFARYAEVNP